MTAVATRLVHPPAVPGEPAGASSTPIYQTATFALGADGSARWDYSRSGNPTRDVLEGQLAQLDGASRSLAYGGGMAAVAAVLRLTRPGEEILVGEDLYGGTHRFLEQLATRWAISVRRVDTQDPAGVAAAVAPHTALVFLETPTNPRLQTVDIQGIATALRRLSGRRPLLAVDNSMLSPYWQRPLELGADIAIQSATKLLGGHGDLTAGVVSVADGELGKELAFLQNAEGSALAPFEAWLLLRGMETLAVRLDRQLENTRWVVEFLRRHRAVKRLYYPGVIPTGAADGAGDTAESGGIVVSFETGSVEFSRKILEEVRLFRTTVSFGSVTSSISVPWDMSHASMGEEERRTAGLAADLVRLSIGLEDPDDLLADLDRALSPQVVEASRTAPQALGEERRTLARRARKPSRAGARVTSGPVTLKNQGPPGPSTTAPKRR